MAETDTISRNELQTTGPDAGPLDSQTADFYRRAMTVMNAAGVSFLVGGAYAFTRYTGIRRHTKDFDVFVHPRDVERALDTLARNDCQIERSFSHWLGKAWCGEDFVDVIFGSGNGVARVDDGWFEHAVKDEVLGMPALIVPAEEMIWSKSFIMERERFDGADVNHLLHCCADKLDWHRLLARFGPNWRVLLAHVLLFGYVYPADVGKVPSFVLDVLLDRVRSEQDEPSQPETRLCRGPFLSRQQYLVDLERWGYRDARLWPVGNMSEGEIEEWTAAAQADGDDEKGIPTGP